MLVDKDALSEILARLKAEKDTHTIQAEERPRVNAALLRDLKPIRPRIISELARRMKKSRWGIYYMLTPEYGRSPKSLRETARINELLRQIRAEVEAQLIKSADQN